VHRNNGPQNTQAVGLNEYLLNNPATLAAQVHISVASQQNLC
jgi:hypothetical protein